jgi:phosphotransferase system HPr-like phosphotransfer protein
LFIQDTALSVSCQGADQSNFLIELKTLVIQT